MNGAQLKEKILDGSTIYGTMLSASKNLRWVNGLVEAELDYVIIDTEHSPFSRSEVSDLILILTNVGIVPIVRIPTPETHYVTMAIDAGAQGILAPYCETVEEVQTVVMASKLRPLKGRRAWKAIESQVFPSQDTKDYLSKRNRNNICIIGIESVPAIDNLGKILAVPGIDAIFVGPNDLSISLGVPEQFYHPDYENALRTVLKACKKASIPVMIHHKTISLTEKWINEGTQIVLHSTDTQMLGNSWKLAFNQIRKFSKI